MRPVGRARLVVGGQAEDRRGQDARAPARPAGRPSGGGCRSAAGSAASVGSLIAIASPSQAGIVRGSLGPVGGVEQAVQAGVRR